MKCDVSKRRAYILNYFTPGRPACFLRLIIAYFSLERWRNDETQCVILASGRDVSTFAHFLNLASDANGTLWSRGSPIDRPTKVSNVEWPTWFGNVKPTRYTVGRLSRVPPQVYGGRLVAPDYSRRKTTGGFAYLRANGLQMLNHRTLVFTFVYFLLGYFYLIGNVWDYKWVV